MNKPIAFSFFTGLVLLLQFIGKTQEGINQADWYTSTPNRRTTRMVAVDKLYEDCPNSNRIFCNGLIVNAVDDIPYNGVQGSTVYFRTAITNNYPQGKITGGTVIASTSFGQKINNTPALAKLNDGKWYVFAATEDGKLYKLDVAGFGIIATTGSALQIADCSRPNSAPCTIHDQLEASPVVQLESSSNSTYTIGKDIVIVGTKHGCSSYTTNMVYAFDASDINKAPLWVFNEFGDYAADYFKYLLLDTGRNAVFCISNLESGRYQNTIWKLNTMTGNLDWAANYGPIQSRPFLGDTTKGELNHLYIASVDKLYAINPDDGVEYWHADLPVIPGEYVNSQPSVGTGEYGQEILLTTSTGQLLAYYDNGSLADGGGEFLWNYKPTGGFKVTGSAAIPDSASKFYAGVTDGTIREFDMATGSTSKYASAYYYSPLLTPAGGAAELLIYKNAGINKILDTFWGGPYDGAMSQYSIPLAPDNSNTRTWWGAKSSAWEDPLNWDPTIVPDENSRVYLVPGGIDPYFNNNIIVSSNPTCRSLYIPPGSTVTVKPGFTLNITH